MESQPDGQGPITTEAVERRRLELKLEPEKLAWLRIKRAIAATNGSAPDHAALAAEVRLALKLIPDRDVRGTMAREAVKVARERKGIELRAPEMLRVLDAEERESQKNDRTSGAGGETQAPAAPSPPVKGC